MLLLGRQVIWRGREERKSETENGGLAFAESGEEAGAVLGGLASPERESAAVVGKGGEHEGLQTLGRWLFEAVHLE